MDMDKGIPSFLPKKSVYVRFEKQAKRYDGHSETDRDLGV